MYSLIAFYDSNSYFVFQIWSLIMTQYHTSHENLFFKCWNKSMKDRPHSFSKLCKPHNKNFACEANQTRIIDELDCGVQRTL